LLSDTQCRKARPGDRDYKLADEKGLYLFVTAKGFKSWRMKYRFAGKEKRLIFGPYPEVSLQAARAARDSARQLLAQDIDPGVEKKQKAAALKADANATFKVMALDWHAAMLPTWSGAYGKTVMNALKRDLFPEFGSLPIGAITKPMVVQRLKAIEGRGAIETAKRARQQIEDIFEHAIGLGHDISNPAAAKFALKPLIQQRRPALTEIGALRTMLWTVEQSRARPVTKLASRMIALTAMRPGTVQTLPWAELDDIDRDDPIWIIPAERMKLSQERKQEEAYDHYVPLATQAMELLASLRILTGRGPLAFPQSRSTRKPLSDATISKMYRDCGYTGQHVPHGWRSSFSTIMNELASRRDRPEDRAIIDLMLAHRPRGTEAIYNRAVYMPRRRAIAQEWADMLLEGFPPVSQLLIVRAP
jgi:integrase